MSISYLSTQLNWILAQTKPPWPVPFCSPHAQYIVGLFPKISLYNRQRAPKEK